MAAKYIISKRSKFSLISIEIATISIFSSYWLCKRFNWAWIIGISVFLGTNLLIGWHFFQQQQFRYLL
ncbi:hypothetical protein, partial [Pseudoxanthomonas sp. KAs_5_3]|uniref:hypothetical protein n=1 Tax=Pseudoxanthomonas sp. KAs_5_3 TaxID=2067658 RepID=UPI001E5821E7